MERTCNILSFSKNDCTAGHEYASAVQRNQLKFSLKDVPPVAPSLPAQAAAPGGKEPRVQINDNHNHQSVVSPTAVMSVKRTMNA